MNETNGQSQAIVPIFTTTDADGDTLNVLRIKGRNGPTWLFTAKGEDGHRSVYLSADDRRELAQALLAEDTQTS